MTRRSLITGGRAKANPLMNFGFWPSRQIVHCSVCGCDPVTPRLSAATDAAAPAAWRSSPPTAAPRRASADLVAERCDAAICPELGEKRKCAAYARSDVDDPIAQVAPADTASPRSAKNRRVLILPGAAPCAALVYSLGLLDPRAYPLEVNLGVTLRASATAALASDWGALATARTTKASFYPSRK